MWISLLIVSLLPFLRLILKGKYIVYSDCVYTRFKLHPLCCCQLKFCCRFNSFAEKVEKLEQSRGLFQAGSLEVSKVKNITHTILLYKCRWLYSILNYINVSLRVKETLSSLVEGLKQRDLLEEVELVFSNEIPFVYQALIGERDKFMADAIDSCECKSMVAVVGMAHMSGIERSLNSANYKMFRKICPRVASSVTTINI